MEETGDESVPVTFERLARWVRDELAAAGLPVVVNGLAPELAVGAEVRIDWLNRVCPDAEPEVVVTWRVGPPVAAQRDGRRQGAAGGHRGDPAVR